MKKSLILAVVLCLLVVFSAVSLAGDYGPNKVKVPVKWRVEPFFHFFLRTNDGQGNQLDNVRYENNELIWGDDNKLNTLDLGTVSPKNRWSGEKDLLGDYANNVTNMHNASFPNIWFELSSNDNWKVVFNKPRLTNRTQDRWTEPVDLYTYFYGFDATHDTAEHFPGMSSGGWTNNQNFVITGDMGYHLYFFMFGMEYENLKTRYGTYKTTLTYTAYQL